MKIDSSSHSFKSKKKVKAALPEQQQQEQIFKQIQEENIDNKNKIKRIEYQISKLNPRIKKMFRENKIKDILLIKVQIET